jgi:hypothetical protein
MLKKISGPCREEVIGGCTKVHNEELHDLYSTADTIRVIKCRRMRWAVHVVIKCRRMRWVGHVVHIEESKMQIAYRVLVAEI